MEDSLHFAAPSRLVILQSSDGDQFTIDKGVIDMSQTVKQLLRGGKGKRSFANSLGGIFTIEDNNVILKKEGRILCHLVKDTTTETVIALHDVKKPTLARVLDFCRFHSTDKTEKERKAYNSALAASEQSVLCELASVRPSIQSFCSLRNLLPCNIQHAIIRSWLDISLKLS
jgi:hypothetical protein